MNDILYNENDNDWANDVKSDPIHISQAESGAKGYFCMGCTKEMQAVIQKKDLNRQSYFRHHIKDVEYNKTECVNSSREYREKLAFFYFMRVKQIKVPAVYKYPPKGTEGFPTLLKESEVITAHRIDREVTFFEDEQGKIHSGKDTNIDERYLMIRPDAVFYDKDDKPILFLEFVVTHKPDTDKLNKLQRLGINTVQIIVPKLAEPELEKSISQVSKIKWTYNEIESNTEYLPTSARYPEGVPSIDEDQRKLFEESYKCRAAQVGNLIRSIKRSLESQSYRRAEHHFEQEISRIEKATREHQSRLDEIQTGIESEIHSELASRGEELDQRRKKFREYLTDLGNRYYSKSTELREQQENTEREITFRRRIGNTEVKIRNEFERLEEDLRREFEYAEKQCSYERSDIESEENDFRRQQSRTLGDIEEESAFARNYEQIENELRSKFGSLEDSEHSRYNFQSEKLRSKNIGIKELRVELENRIRDKFERSHQHFVTRVNNRDIQGGDELSERIKTILEIRGKFGSYEDNQQALKRCNEAIKLITDGIYKKWNR